MLRLITRATSRARRARCAKRAPYRGAPAYPREPLQSRAPIPGDQVMIIRRLLVLSALALAMSPVAGYAGPCSHDIDLMQSRVDARLEAKAAAGPSARESSEATMHRQPTPGSIAAAES